MDEEEGAQDPTKLVIKDSVSRKESPKKVAKEITLDEEGPTEDVTLEVSLDSTEEGNDCTSSVQCELYSVQFTLNTAHCVTALQCTALHTT